MTNPLSSPFHDIELIEIAQKLLYARNVAQPPSRITHPSPNCLMISCHLPYHDPFCLLYDVVQYKIDRTMKRPTA